MNLNHVLDWHLIEDATWQQLVQRALFHKHSKTPWTHAAANKSLGLLFFNSSLRTRTSMELAGAQLGAHVTTLNIGQGTWGFSWQKGVRMDGNEAEHIQEAVGVLSRYYDALGIRAFASSTDLEQDRSEALLFQFADAASVPVVNMESAFFHPCQALGDAATLVEHFGDAPKGRKFVLSWAYHPKPLPMAVPNSALLMATRMGMDVTLACPSEYVLDDSILEKARAYASQHGQSLTLSHDQAEAVKDADIVYVKAWGGPAIYQGSDYEAGIRDQYKTWCMTNHLMETTNQGQFMHCLPIRRNVVAEDAVLDGNQTIHLLQAEFRLHAQKAILEYMWQTLPSPAL